MKRGGYIGGPGKAVINGLDIQGREVGLTIEDANASIGNSTIANNKIGIEILGSSDVDLKDSNYIDNYLKDVVYNPNVDSENLDSVAEDALNEIELSLPLGRDFRPVEIEIEKHAVRVLSAESDQEKREAFVQLAKYSWWALEKTGTVVFAAQVVMKGVDGLSKMM